MKLWAVVIGRKGRHTRYVAQFISRQFLIPLPLLHVYERRKDAREVRKQLLENFGDKDVYVVRFLSE